MAGLRCTVGILKSMKKVRKIGILFQIRTTFLLIIMECRSMKKNGAALLMPLVLAKEFHKSSPLF
jgi:hypothetical protein